MRSLSQRNRRLLVIVSVLLMVSVFVPAVSNSWILWIVMALFAVIWGGFYTSLGKVWLESDQQLDERQRAFKYKIYRQSYRALMLLFIWLMLLYALVDKAGLPLGDASDILRSSVAGYFLTLFTLPSLLIAWLEPDPIREETENIQILKGENI